MSDELDDVLDEDLQELLDELDETEDAVDQMMEELDQQEDETDDGSEEFEELPDEEILRPVDIRELDVVTTPMESVPSAPVAPTVDVVKYHDRLDQVTTEVLAACRADRQEAQDVIDLLRLQIDDAVNKSQAPQRMWVDGLVKAVEVKAGINATAVKIIEANAKMLAATRAGVNILNQNIQTGTEDLEDVLSRPLTEQDGY